MTELSSFIRTIENFPRQGIMFRDVTTLFKSAKGLQMAIDATVAAFETQQIDYVAGLEARGFILGGAVAARLGAGFIPLRKAGKLPAATITQDYELEYGSATLEVHDDAIEAGAKVLIVDDLLATGGTAAAGISLIERLGGDIVALSFIIDLPELGGGQKLRDMGYDVHHLCAFEGH